jgi:dihydrodipicolinate synthase/N-acetylneuraminate lyase
MALLRALQRQDMTEAQRLYDMFLPLETLRDSVSLIRVLHDAVTWSGVADMGAQLPLLSPSPFSMRGEIEATARQLLAADATS